MKRPVRTLLFSTLYPSSVRPSHGIFVETRLRELLSTGAVETKVVAPVPWFFSRNPRFGDYARMAATPKYERHNGIEVHHPRYVLPPKVGMNIAPLMLALGVIPTIKRLQREGFDFDLIDAHYYYPDGVAAAILSQYFKRPFTVTARGTDINLISNYAFPRKLMCWAADHASASISVCRALRDEIASMGADPAKLFVLRNGVDLERFRPLPQVEAKVALGWPSSRKTILSVGLLVERKGHYLVIEALRDLPEFDLVIAGDGPDRRELENLARKLQVADRVHFAGSVPQVDLYRYYSAADILILASSREGWANVLLESMACGTPVVATRIWGTPEVVSAPEAGRLADERTPASLARAVTDLLANYPERTAVRRYAERFSWTETTEGQLSIFNDILRPGA